MRRSSLLLLLLTTSAHSQAPLFVPSGVITGTVHDPSDAAIVGAEVAALGPDGVLVFQTTTDGECSASTSLALVIIS
jgi:hypothetical protein